jgi:hypothetical protein
MSGKKGMWEKKKIDTTNFNYDLPYRNLPYKYMESNIHGWIKADEYKPAEYELVELQTNIRKVKGWRQLGSWFIRKALPNEKVLLWKRIPSRNH